MKNATLIILSLILIVNFILLIISLIPDFYSNSPLKEYPIVIGLAFFFSASLFIRQYKIFKKQ